MFKPRDSLILHQVNLSEGKKDICSKNLSGDEGFPAPELIRDLKTLLALNPD